MEKRYLPIGTQDFRKLRERNNIYVDKTERIHSLCKAGRMYFLARPRRFGKSLLLSTMSELFKGSKNLFEGLWIADHWDWTVTNPVIHISFASVDYEEKGLVFGIRKMLLELYAEFDAAPPHDHSIKGLFTTLIKQIHAKQGKVVILIDEYDKPIIDYMETHELDRAKANQVILGNFYGGLKDADPFIRMLFITGVSKFTKVSLFSKLNNLDDLTINPHYSTLLGYTQQELEYYFVDYIDDALPLFPEYNRQQFLEKVRVWYNGYSWDGVNRLYNPFGTLLFLESREFQSHWFQSGTPTFLVKMLLKQDFFHLENIETTINFLNQYSLDNLELTSLLFQTGYLTIKEKSKEGYLVLSYPNQEVREATYEFIITDMGHPRGGGGMTIQHLQKAFMSNDLEKAEDILTALFGGLPFDVYTHQTVRQIEGFYHGLVHILFQCLGLHMQSEVHTSKGRADCIVQTPTHIYILEFKLDSNAQHALTQIENKRYAKPFAADPRIKVGIGINFNSLTKELDGWETQVLT